MSDTRYGNTRIGKIKAAYDDLRMAIRSGDMEASNAALDRYEPWADFAFSPPPQGRFIEAADALAGALSESRETHCGIAEHILQQGPRANRRAIFADSQRARLAIDKAQIEYRAAREAITRGTPPAFATSA